MTEKKEYIWPRDANTKDQRLAPPINWHLSCQKLRRKTQAQGRINHAQRTQVDQSPKLAIRVH